MRVDICMFILRVAAVVTLQIYTGVLLRTSIEFSVGTFVDILHIRVDHFIDALHNVFQGRRNLC